MISFAEVHALHVAFSTTASDAPATTITHWIETNHRFNTLLWDEEDLARRTRATDAEIAANKRAIDGYNQARNDAVERMDEIMLVALNIADVSQHKSGARHHSETAGAMIDRLSILALKIRAMTAQTQRTDADAAHVANATQKLIQLKRQHSDLGACFDALIKNCAEGSEVFKIYRQFKMYNDPRYNPALVAESKGA